MADRKRCCCNCGNNIRTPDKKYPGVMMRHCAIDGHYIGYIECFVGWCRRWKKDRTFDGRTEENAECV